ncbi:hypothetical protein FJT64_019119 [Amphibalanus amphitrite]|uniref:DUF5641 domain-containing protein n=1 Tax=Amphibalanus amphitrite TaxID=1232801 RepID=A0A6A4WQP2_AMPAM|nr:hypothetical protein FJT64_010066 [Amphibalanus amphitrite]KAF0309786.1 hypothetical protein FJT64_019119 [Amphibalanus amphitrite]
MPDKMSEEVEVLVKDRTLLRAKGKLPESWRLEWARQHQPDPGLEDFLGFLRKEMDMREEANIGARHPVPPERSPLHSTALVEASGPRGTCQLRVLLDGGSDSSYVRTSAAELLGLPTVGRGVFACLGFQERLEEPRMYEKVRLSLRSRHGGEPHVFDLWKTDRLCSQLTPARPPTAVFTPHLLLADDFEGGPVDVLIGADLMYRVVLWEQVKLTDHLRALETVFGYVLHGRDGSPVDCEPVDCASVKYALRCCRLPSPDFKPEQLWSLEALGISGDEDERSPMKPKWSDAEQRYEMNLLWKSDDRPLSNLSSAAARIGRMEGRLTVPEREAYQRHLEDLYRAGVIETPPNDDLQGFYLPHRGIWRGGKLRVVFDGSARDATGHSLNDYLEPGSNLLRRLPAVLLNFRRDAVGAQTDIRAAFHQVSVSEEDRKYLQFLWDGQRLRFRRVPFGITCSPFMLLQTISVHLDLYCGEEPGLCEKLQCGLYMDDVCTSFCSRAEAESSMSRAEEIFRDAGMELHKRRISGDADSEANVLGLLWNPATDLLAVSVPGFHVAKTRREMLSLLSKPFDPLGVLSPWLVVGRSLFQRTWGVGCTVSWDEELPPQLQEELAEWLTDAPDRTVWFPRALLTNDCDVTYHVFCDASKKAYCCVIYAVQGGESRLLMSKSRLAPLTPALSVPRLELMGALIGARLMDFVRQALSLESPQVVYWTDSMDVIFWLKSKKKLKLFVQNRVTTILQLTQAEQWHHVRGQDNPADLGTRGMSMTALEKCDLWWRGPTFLRQGPDTRICCGPTVEADSLQPSQEATSEVKLQKPPLKLTLLTTRSDTSETLPFDITSCSTLTQAVLRLAWVFRFVTNSRLPREERRTGPLTPEEKRLSLRFWIREAQARAYREETNAVRAGKLLPAGSPLQKLHPQLSDDGVLEATLRSGERAVPVLPDLAHVTTLIVDDAHRLCFHQGTRVTLSLLTAEYAVRRRTGDGEDLLTPAHLLFGVTSIDGVLCPTLKECSISRAWRHQKRVCDHLIRRWCDEYRNALRCWSVSPRGRPSRTPRVGDVVLVHSERPRGRWPVARVTRLLAGPDGHVRAAVISLRGRSTRRPVSRLFLLEAAD